MRHSPSFQMWRFYYTLHRPYKALALKVWQTYLENILFGI